MSVGAWTLGSPSNPCLGAVRCARKSPDILTALLTPTSGHLPLVSPLVEFLYPCIIVYNTRRKVNALGNSRNCVFLKILWAPAWRLPKVWLSCLRPMTPRAFFLPRHVYLQANSKAAPISHKPTPQVTHATKPPFLFMALFYPAREEFSILSVNYSYTYVLYYLTN